jgi:hypothetical protein
VAGTVRPETPRDPPRPARSRLEPLGRNDQRVDDDSAESLVQELRTLTVDGVLHATKVIQAAANADDQVHSLKQAGVVDALVRALDTTSIDVITSVLAASRELLCVNDSLSASFFTAGIFPALQVILSSQEKRADETLAGTCAILLKLLSEEFAHAFAKFDLLTRLTSLMLEHLHSQVVITATVSTVAKVVSVGAALENQFSLCGALVRVLESGTHSGYVHTRAAYALDVLLQQEPTLLADLLRKHCDLPRVFSGSLARFATPSQSGVRDMLLRLMLRLSTDRRFVGGANQTTVLTDVVENHFAGETVLALACLANITYFDAWDDQDSHVLCQCVLGVLFDENTDLVLEATRALGNISKRASSRSTCVDLRIPEVLVELSAHPDPRIVFNAMGALLNFTADPQWTKTNESPLRAMMQARQQDWEDQDELLELIHALQHNVAHAATVL